MQIVLVLDKVILMLVSFSNKTALALRFLLFIIIGILFSLSVLLYADEDTSSITSQFDRVDVETIKMHTHQILSEPTFLPRKTFWQWLSEKFSKWKGPKFDLGPGWKTFILSVLTIWCVLTLIAILIHFIWSIGLLIRSDTNSLRAKRASSSGSVKLTSFEELYKITQELAQKKAFREAISIMIVALLRWLDFRGIVHFHESKTNGDYVREYPSGYAGHDEFKTFVVMFEQTIYGGPYSNEKTYWKMNSLMKHIHNCVVQKQ